MSRFDILHKLVNTANELDRKGRYEEADDIDRIIIHSGFMETVKEWFTGTPCKCNCEGCEYAEAGGMGVSSRRKYHCGGDQCPVKQK